MSDDTPTTPGRSLVPVSQQPQDPPDEPIDPTDPADPADAPEIDEMIIVPPAPTPTRWPRTLLAAIALLAALGIGFALGRMTAPTTGEATLRAANRATNEALAAAADAQDAAAAARAVIEAIGTASPSAAPTPPATTESPTTDPTPNTQAPGPDDSDEDAGSNTATTAAAAAPTTTEPQPGCRVDPRGTENRGVEVSDPDSDWADSYVFLGAEGQEIFSTADAPPDEEEPTRRRWYALQGEVFFAGSVISVAPVRGGEVGEPLLCVQGRA